MRLQGDVGIALDVEWPRGRALARRAGGGELVLHDGHVEIGPFVDVRGAGDFVDAERIFGIIAVGTLVVGSDLTLGHDFDHGYTNVVDSVARVAFGDGGRTTADAADSAGSLDEKTVVDFRLGLNGG